jgi:hypothetical protein
MAVGLNPSPSYQSNLKLILGWFLDLNCSFSFKDVLVFDGISEQLDSTGGNLYLNLIAILDWLISNPKLLTCKYFLTNYEK